MAHTPTQLSHPTALPARLLSLCEDIKQSGGHAWLVGGCVRDMMLGLSAKDFDLEVFGLTTEQLQLLLRQHGRTELVGKQFGVIKLWMGELEIDVALPRVEHKTSAGHRGFSVQTNPDLSPASATLRRDFTINAMMWDPLTSTLLDFHNGQNDLKAKILRHVSPAFVEDPLRPLRAIQFAARFALHLHPDTARVCQTMLSEAKSLPSSRIWEEWKKWSLSKTPSYGLKVLSESGWLTLYPELEALVDCPQNPRWHPEGDVWIHTLQCCDQAASIAIERGLDSDEQLLLVLATLCHDLGKPATTLTLDQGEICSPGHSEAGLNPSQTLLARIAAPNKLSQLILPLVKEHITHLHGEPTSRAVRRLAHRLEPANIRIWEMLVQADASGRAPAPASRPAWNWLVMAEKMAHADAKPAPILNGKLLISLGIKPGPRMGKIIAQAYEAQLDGLFHDQASALEWLRQKN